MRGSSKAMGATNSPVARADTGVSPISTASRRSYHWVVSITDETNTRGEKAAYLDAVHRTMAELLGGVAEHSYVHVADLRANAYGYGGTTQAQRYAVPA